MKVYQILISSPADLAPERKVAIETINTLTHFAQISYGIELKPVTWEENSYPAFGKDPQDVLNTQLSNKQDIYLGMLWKRLGTPTARHLSGTVEEFEQAYQRFSDDPLSTRILIYFKRIPEEIIDDEEPRKVVFFKENLQARGYYTWQDFLDTNEFRSYIPIHLYQAIHDLNAERKAKGWVEEDDGRRLLMKANVNVIHSAYNRIFETLKVGLEKGNDFLADYTRYNDVLSSATGREFTDAHEMNAMIENVNSELATIDISLQEKLLAITDGYLDFILSWVKFLILIDDEDVMLDKQAKEDAIAEIDSALSYIRRFVQRFTENIHTVDQLSITFDVFSKNPLFGSLGFNYDMMEAIMESERMLAKKLIAHFTAWEGATTTIRELFDAIPSE